MTLQEVAKKLGKSEITLKTQFKRTQENLRKKGIFLVKKGYGNNADFQIIYEEEKKNNGTV